MGEFRAPGSARGTQDRGSDNDGLTVKDDSVYPELTSMVETAGTKHVGKLKNHSMPRETAG